MNDRTYLRFECFRAGILAALGLAPLACGPVQEGTSSDDTTAGSTTQGTTATGPGTTTMGLLTTTEDPTSTGGSIGATGTESTGETTTGSGPTTGPTTGDETGPALSCPLDCQDPVELEQSGGDVAGPTGLVQCAGGLIHRAEAVACVVPAGFGTCTEPLEGSTCEVDADCVEKPFGRCDEGIQCGFTAGVCGCNYGCETDADCGAGEVCLCSIEGISTRSHCVPAGCTTDADCGGSACAASTDAVNSPLVAGFACHADGDACCDDSTCDAGAQCRFGVLEPDVWACDFGADCGRPLRVEGRTEVAGAAERGDWRATIAMVQVPAPATCAALADYWQGVALAEHASVGSFARFILQLLAVGAPASLVAGAQQALADEVEHARVGFALAAAYGGREVGPGPLPAACGPLVADLEGVVQAVIAEACVGETLSALAVAEAAARAEDPAVAAVLARIADDEARHAELGWSFVRWALAEHAGLREAAGGWFAAAIAAAGARAGRAEGVEAAPAGGSEAGLRRFGVVDAELQATLVRGGLAEVVRPCAAALLPAA